MADRYQGYYIDITTWTFIYAATRDVMTNDNMK